MSKKKTSVLEKHKGLSFAEAAEKVLKKYPNRDVDNLARKAFEEEMKMLFKSQHLKAIQKEMQAKTAQAPSSLGTVSDMAMPQGLPNTQTEQLVKKYAWGNSTDIDPTKPKTGYAYTTPDIENTLIYDPQNPVNDPLLKSVFNQYSGASFKETPVTSLEQQIKPLDGKKITLPEASKIAKESKKDNEMNAYLPALIGSALSGLTNAAMLSGGYDRVNAVRNPYEDDIKDKLDQMMINKEALRNQLLSRFNFARESAGTTRNESVRQAIIQNANSNLASALGESELTSQIQLNQLLGSQAGMLQQLGAGRMNADFQAQELEARNKGNYQTQLSATAANVFGDTGKFITLGKLNKAQNEMMVGMLNSQGYDFEVSTQVASLLGSGKIKSTDDIIKMKQNGKISSTVAEAATKIYPTYAEWLKNN